ncbi:MAG: hypothetical protein ABIY70_21695 [Capsulimonas sp.]|uniref:hypothetical protein n=1 Tax=Capsulimonas sp. TaxID=2494211 RepID=UPI003267EB9D
MSVSMGSGYAPNRRVDFGWIGESWRLFSQSPAPWIVLFLINLVINGILRTTLHAVFPNPNFSGNTPGMPAWAGAMNTQMSPAGQIVSSLIGWPISSFFAACFYRMAVRQVRGETIGTGDMFEGGPYFVQMLIANFVLGVLYIGGVIACCVGVFAVAGLMLPMQAMVADGVPAMDAVTRSYNAMKSDLLNAALFSFVLVLVVLAGIIPCGLGLFATVPMAYLMGALAYRDMGDMPGITPFAPDYGAPQPGAWPPPPNTGASAGFGQPGGAPQFGQPPAQSNQPGAWPAQPSNQPGAWPPPQAPDQPSSALPSQGAAPSDWPAQSTPPPFGQTPPTDPQSPPDDPNRPLGGV